MVISVIQLISSDKQELTVLQEFLQEKCLDSECNDCVHMRWLGHVEAIFLAQLGFCMPWAVCVVAVEWEQYI